MKLADTAELVREHAATLERLAARRLRGEEEAADLVQSVWCRWLERGPAAPPPRDPRRFLVTMALNLIRDAARGRRRREAGRQALEPLLDPAAPCTERLALARRDRADLVAAVDGLPPRTRAVLLLFRVEGLGYRAIAERLGISPRTVEHHLREAMVRLRRDLAEPP